MKKLSFEEFTVKIYSESIYKTLSTTVGDKKVKNFFLKKDYKDQKEIENKLKELSAEIAEEFVQNLKSKGFPDQEIPQDDQKRILKGIINEHIQTGTRE